MQIPIRNSIISSNDVSYVINYFKKSISQHNIKIFGEPKKMFTIDLSRAILLEATKTSYEVKYILIVGETFKTEAQNALLKLLEETPPNIVAVIITENKTSVLPTIRSRLHKFFWRKPVKEATLKDEIDYLNITEKSILRFLLDNKRISRDKVKSIMETTLKIDTKMNLKTFNLDELDKITDLLKLLNVNSSATNVLTLFLMLVFNAVNRKRNTHM